MMAASTHVHDPHMLERVSWVTKRRRLLWPDTGEFVPRPPSPPPAPFLQAVPKGQSQGGEMGWGDRGMGMMMGMGMEWVEQITIQ